MASLTSRADLRVPKARRPARQTPAMAPLPLAHAIRVVLCSCAVTTGALADPEFAARPVGADIEDPAVMLTADLDKDGDTDVVVASGQQVIAWFENDGRTDPGFQMRTISTAVSDVNALFMADFDRDGDMDVLATSESGNRIVWLKNDGSESFNLATITDQGNPASAFAADLDGDGDADVLTAAPASGVRWYKNELSSDQGFSPRTVTDSIAASDVFGADMDGDGDIDIVTFAVGDNPIRWFENDGTQEPDFTDRTIAAAADQPAALYAVDLDGDGDTDVLSAGTQNGWLGWHENQGGTFSVRTLDASAGVTAVSAYDLDADGDTDVLAAGPNGSAWYENTDGSAQTFTLREIDGASPVTQIVAADLDADGDLDPVTLDSTQNILTWHESTLRERFASFGEAETLAAQSQASALVVLDIDGDGDQDAATASGPGNVITWHENTGSFPFTSRTVASTNGPSSLTFADLNRNGHLDLVAAVEGAGQIAWYENNRLRPAAFAQRTVTSGASAVSEVIVADLNRDGFVDVISASATQNTLAWYAHDGAQTPTFTPQTLSTTATGVGPIFTADLDADGDLDIVAVTDAGETITWYESSGSPAPTFDLKTIALSGGAISSTFPADLDADGDVDIVVASLQSGAVSWYENDGEAAPDFTIQTLVTGGTGVTSIAVADGDSDGDLDLLLGLGTSGATWLQNQGQGIFTHQSLADSGQVELALASDIEGDGDIDLLAAQGNEVVWFRNTSVHQRAAFVSKNVVSANARSAFAVFATDLDLDGDTDILSSSFQDDKVAWYENDGGQEFTLRTISLQANSTRSVFAIDVDGDGDTDVLAASRDDNKVSWYENDGDQNFAEHTITDNALEAVFVRAADVDRDGDIDVLSASRIDNKIAWYENDGGQQFSVHTITTDMFYATAVYPVDINGDGEIDVLAASFGDDKVLWFENDGNENFSEHTITVDFDGPRSMHFADVDADGDIDVVTASVLDNTIAWHEYDGTAFSSHTVTTNAIEAAAVYAADLDDDGDIDILSGSIADDTVAWFENDGAQSFTGYVIDTDSDSPRDVIAADIDSDGDLDVLAASRFDNTVAWYENCGAQFAVLPENQAPTNAVEGERVTVMSVSWVYQGRDADAPASPDGAALRWTDGLGTALTAAAAKQTIKRVLFHHDLTGDGLTADDELLSSTTRIPLTPVALTEAAQQFHFEGPSLTSPSEPVTILISVDVADFAANQNPGSFQVTLATQPSGAQARTPGSGFVLAEGCRSEFSSKPVTALPATDRLLISSFE